jgi:acyl-CoA thioesterase
MSFSEATKVTGGPGTWKGTVAEGWDIFGVTNGGYLMSIGTRAMEAEADGRILISATGIFTNPAGPGPLDVLVEPLKHGRSLSTLRAVLSMYGKDLVQVTGVFADPDRPKHEADLPPPEECVLSEPATDAPLPPPFTGKIELRVPPEDAEAFLEMKGDRPLSRGWFRLRDGEAIDAHAVVMAADSFAPAIFNDASLAMGWTPTVDLAVQVRNPSPQGWLACHFTTRFINEGLMEEDGEIWDQSGNLVALSRQLALVPR